MKYRQQLSQNWMTECILVCQTELRLSRVVSREASWEKTSFPCCMWPRETHNHDSDGVVSKEMEGTARAKCTANALWNIMEYRWIIGAVTTPLMRPLTEHCQTLIWRNYSMTKKWILAITPVWTKEVALGSAWHTLTKLPDRAPHIIN